MHLFKPPPEKPTSHFLGVFINSLPLLADFLHQVTLWMAAFSIFFIICFILGLGLLQLWKLMDAKQCDEQGCTLGRPWRSMRCRWLTRRLVARRGCCNSCDCGNEYGCVGGATLGDAEARGVASASRSLETGGVTLI